MEGREGEMPLHARVRTSRARCLATAVRRATSHDAHSWSITPERRQRRERWRDSTLERLAVLPWQPWLLVQLHTRVVGRHASSLAYVYLTSDGRFLPDNCACAYVYACACVCVHPGETDWELWNPGLWLALSILPANQRRCHASGECHPWLRTQTCAVLLSLSEERIQTVQKRRIAFLDMIDFFTCLTVVLNSVYLMKNRLQQNLCAENRITDSLILILPIYSLKFMSIIHQHKRDKTHVERVQYNKAERHTSWCTNIRQACDSFHAEDWFRYIMFLSKVALQCWISFSFCFVHRLIFFWKTNNQCDPQNVMMWSSCFSEPMICFALSQKMSNTKPKNQKMNLLQT